MAGKASMKVGEVFPTKTSGNITVVEYINANKVRVSFSSGTQTIATADNIRKGEVKNRFIPTVCGIGYLGGTKYRATHPAYQNWKAMLRRCYDDKASCYPYYGAKGCQVAKEWHNFQTFAKWFEEHGGEKGMVVDKDLLHIAGVKVYSPYVCTVMTPTENTNERNNRHLKEVL